MLQPNSNFANTPNFPSLSIDFNYYLLFTCVQIVVIYITRQ